MRYCFLIFPFFYISNALSSDVAVVTLTIGKTYQKVVAPSIENKQAYCLHHGYDFICGEESLDESRRPGWNKILILLETMKNPAYKWVFWTDADSLFMNFNLPLENLIDENYHLIITRDMFTINAGQFFIRNNEWGRQFLLDVYSHTESIHHCTVDLQGFIFEIQKREKEQSIKILPQKLMNSYAKEVIGFFPPSVLRSSAYESGDFIIHFSGEHNLSKLSSLFEKYSKKAIIKPLQEKEKNETP